MSATSVTQRNRKREEEEDLELLDKEKRIQANLARLESTTQQQPSVLRAPLQWKGYAWRFMRGFNDAPLASSDVSATAPSASGAAPSSSALDGGGGATWKQWAILGIKQRSCRVITVVLLATVVTVLLLVYGFALTYGYAMSTDPCVVSRETAQHLKDFPRSSKHEHQKTLPKIIHQQWKNATVPAGVYSTWHAKFKELYPEPEYTHMLWTNDNALELITNHFPFFLEAYNGYEFDIQRADAARYFVMYKYGGLYADLDYEPLVNFWEHLPKDRAALVESPYLYNEKSQNSLMSSPARDPFWNETFVLLLERKDRPVLQATGPMFLDALMVRATETFALLPCENFQRLPLHLSAEEEVSPFMSQLHREVVGRLAPMKSCGDYHNDACQYGKHHNTASYLSDTGVFKLLWG